MLYNVNINVNNVNVNNVNVKSLSPVPSAVGLTSFCEMVVITGAVCCGATPNK